MKRLLIALAAIFIVASACKDRDRPENGASQTKSVESPPHERGARFSGPRAARCERTTGGVVVTNLAERSISQLTIWTYTRAADGRDVTARKSAVHDVELPVDGELVLPISDGSECEVSQVTWGDGTRWSNKNLVYRVGESRAPPSDEELADRERPKVFVRQVDADRLLFEFENVSGRPLTLNQIALAFLDADGAVLRQAAVRSDLVLKAGAKYASALNYPKAQVPENTRRVRASVTTVTFADGDRETVTNHNE